MERKILTGSARLRRNVDVSPDCNLATQMLGGRAVLRRPIRNEIEAHMRIREGLPFQALVRLARHLRSIPTAVLLEVVGISERTFRRRGAVAEQDSGAKLNVNESSRLWTF